jgi:hypothetical protein
MADLNIKPSSPAPGSGDSGQQPAPEANAPGKIEIKAETPPAPKAEAAPAAATPAVPAPAEDKSTFQNIFGKKEEKADESKIISGVLKKKTVADKLKPILGHGPTLQKAIEAEKEMTMKKKLRFIQSMLILAFVFGGLVAGYFYTSLSPDFNLWQNKTAQLTDMNKNIRSLQTQLNKYRYLAAQLDLNQFSYNADQFLDKVTQYNDPNVSTTEKSVISVGIDEAQFQLPTLLERIRDNLQGSLTIETFHSAAEADVTPEDEKTEAENSLRDALRADKNLFSQAEDSPQKTQDLRSVDNTIKIVGNSRLMSTILKTSADEFTAMLDEYKTNPDPLKRSTVQAKIADILSSTKSDIATISSLKNTRVDWLTVITQIETVTREVDSNFGRGLFETLGGIIYDGYEFDSKTNKIVLSGQIKTNDATNFSMTSDLIEALEGSDHFQNVEMRSFTKTGTPETGFTSSFKLDLALEMNGESDKNEPISLEPRKIAVKIKRAEIKEESSEPSTE